MSHSPLAVYLLLFAVFSIIAGIHLVLLLGWAVERSPLKIFARSTLLIISMLVLGFYTFGFLTTKEVLSAKERLRWQTAYFLIGSFATGAIIFAVKRDE